MSLPKTMEQWENADLGGTKKFKKVIFIEFESLCQKLWDLRQIYPNHSPNIGMSRDPGLKFQKFLFLPNSVLNFRKSYQIWGKLIQEQKRYRQKTNWGVENIPPPSAKVKYSLSARNVYHENKLH